MPTPPDMLYNSIPTNGILSTTPEIIVQLARPLDGAVKPVFVFQPQQSSAPSVNADVTVSGAHVKLRMLSGTSLQPMTIYDVVPDKNSYPAANKAASLVIPSFTFSTE